MRTVFATVLSLAILAQFSLQDQNDIKDQNSQEQDRFAFWNLRKCCRELKEDVGDAEDDISSNKESINSTCNALTALLLVMQPEYDPNAAECPPAPMPNPVSAAIGSDTGSEYPIIFPITLNGAALQDGIAPEGLNTADSQPQTLGTSMDQAALSITDFNVFRIQMVKALRILDKSVRGILDTQAPTCP